MSRAAVGLLQRRPISSSPAETELTGKEGNKLVERASGEVTDPADYRNTYGTRGDTWQLVLDILREIGVPTIVEQTGFSRSAVYAVLNGATPRTDHADAYTELAAQHIRERFTAWEIEPARRTPQLLVPPIGIGLSGSGCRCVGRPGLACRTAARAASAANS